MDNVASLGLERKTVRLVPYDPHWPRLYAAEAARIMDRLGTLASDIAHIGSTAVPGLEAKPVLDVMLAIPALRAPPALYVALADLDYAHHSVDALPDRHLFVRERTGLRTHHLSVCEAHSRFWWTHLRFRDCLRAHPQLARAYLELKRELARRFPHDRLAYTDGKDAFVAQVLCVATAGGTPRGAQP